MACPHLATTRCRLLLSIGTARRERRRSDERSRLLTWLFRRGRQGWFKTFLPASRHRSSPRPIVADIVSVKNSRIRCHRLIEEWSRAMTSSMCLRNFKRRTTFASIIGWTANLAGSPKKNSKAAARAVRREFPRRLSSSRRRSHCERPRATSNLLASVAQILKIATQTSLTTTYRLPKVKWVRSAWKTCWSLTTHTPSRRVRASAAFSFCFPSSSMSF